MRQQLGTLNSVNTLTFVLILMIYLSLNGTWKSAFLKIALH